MKKDGTVYLARFVTTVEPDLVSGPKDVEHWVIVKWGRPALMPASFGLTWCDTKSGLGLKGKPVEWYVLEDVLKKIGRSP